MSKKIAIYGNYKATILVKQRYWKKRADGVKQRYWRKTVKAKGKAMSGRYEFQGTGKELYKAVAEAYHTVPRDFINVSAKEFLKNTEKYGFEGKWVDREVKS